MKGNLKRVFQSMFMVLATVMLLSIPASAASSKTVATIGKKSYTSLEAAVKKVKKGQTIKLKKDVKVYSLTLNRNVKYTINLNGHKITRKNSKAQANLYIKKGTVTIKNGTIGCTVTVHKNASLTTASVKMQSKYTPGITVNKKGKLTVKSGTYYDIINRGTLSIKGGTYNSSVENAGTLTIAKGTFKDSLHNLKAGTMTIKAGTFKGMMENLGKATISGGTFNFTDKCVINQSGATMKISGGTFNLNSSDSSLVMMSNKGAMTISGGKINLNNGNELDNGGTLTISGGTITNPSTKSGANVVRNTGTFKMTGGTLKGCSSSGYALDNFGSATINGGNLITPQVYKVYNETGSISSSVLSKSQIYDPFSN